MRRNNNDHVVIPECLCRESTPHERKNNGWIPVPERPVRPDIMFIMERDAFAGMTVVLLSLAINSLHASEWGNSSLWNDGRAEVAVYDAERVVYTKPRTFRETFITVKEDLRSDTLVKADDPRKQKTIRVFKMNQVQKFDTENYPYSYLASVFVKESPVSATVKISVGAQEWCGNTYKLFRAGDKGSVSTLEWHSYFDGEADQTVSLDWKAGDYFQDQLPLSLRGLSFKSGTSEKIRLWDMLLTNRGTLPQPVDAVVSVEGEELVRCHCGALASWKVNVTSAKGTDTYWFEKKEPNILTRMETQDGRKRLLYSRVRWSYWDRRLPKPSVLN